MQEHHDTGSPVCPYCGHEEEDCFERGVGDFPNGILQEFDCEACGRTYFLAVVTTVSFSSKPLELISDYMIRTIYLPAWPGREEAEAQHFFAEHLELECDCRVVEIGGRYAITFVGCQHEQAIRVLYEQMPDYFASEVKE